VVFADHISGNIWDIYGYDLSTGTEFPICTHPGYQTWPAIYGNIVVWQERRNFNWDIYGYDLSTGTEFPICTHMGLVWKPEIYGNIVVWWDYRNFNVDIYGYDLSTGTVFSICTHPADQEWAEIYGNIVVWRDERNGNGDIYGAKLGGELTSNPIFAPSLQNPDINKYLEPLASYRISQVENLLEDVLKMCEKLKDEQNPLYTTCCVDRLDRAKELLKETENFFASGNYIAANTFALEALDLLEQILECCIH
jgi:beta propeller repeat protein